jgi:hypothetical protein
MFIGAKMLADPWVHISTGLSLAIVGAIIAFSILISAIVAKRQENSIESAIANLDLLGDAKMNMKDIELLAAVDPNERVKAAFDVFSLGLARALPPLQAWESDEDLRDLIVREKVETALTGEPSMARLTVGVAVHPAAFEKIRAANGFPRLADAPADQDVLEFELDFPQSEVSYVHLDILTTKAPGGGGAIARFLEKFGEGIQQVELDVTDVNLAAQIVRTRFKIDPIYPTTRPGANGTRVNFFLVPGRDNQKVLVELVEQPKGSRQSPVTSH